MTRPTDPTKKPTTKPAPPAVFDAREAAARAVDRYPPFRFTDLDGAEFSFPHPMLVDPDLARRVQGMDMTVDEFLDEVAPEAWAAVQKMPPYLQAELLGAWQAKAQADVAGMPGQGKGPGKLSGPNRATRRSKSTSPSAAKTSPRSRSTGSGRSSTGS